MILIDDLQRREDARLMVPNNTKGFEARFGTHPAALLLFAAGLSAMGLFGWRRKRKTSEALAA